MLKLKMNKKKILLAILSLVLVSTVGITLAVLNAPKKEEPKQNDATPSNEGNEHQTSVPTNKVEELPQTGTGNEFAIFGAAASSILAGLGLVIPKKKENE